MKTRQYLGPILTNRKRLLPMILPFLLFILFVIPVGSEYARPRTDIPFFLDVESAAAVLSILLTFSFAQGLGGGIMAHASEVDFVLTTPIRPRRYLAAEWGFQLLILHIFLVPFVAGFCAGIGIGSRDPLRGLSVFAVGEVFLLLPGLIAQSIGVLVGMNHRGAARGIVLAAAVVLLLPALHFVVPFPLRYADLPGPPQFATTLAFGIARHGAFDGVALLGLLAYVGVAAATWVALSGKEFFPGVRPMMVMSFGQPMDFSQIARLAAERGKARRTRLAVDVFNPNLPTAMTKLQLAKWTRSRVLPAAIAMLSLFGFMGLVFAHGSAGVGPVATSPFAIIPILLPSLLALPTFSSERDRLWAYTIIPDGMPRFFQALFVSQIAVAIPLVIVAPAIVMLLTSSLSAYALMALAGAALGSTWAATLFLTKFDVPLGTFSFRPMLFLTACGLGALPLSMPALVLGPFVAGDVLGSLGLTLAYAVGLSVAGTMAHRWIGRAAESFVLERAEQNRSLATAPFAARRGDVERAYSVLAKATFGMILFAFVFLLVAIQPLWYRAPGPSPGSTPIMSPVEAAAAAVLSGGIVLLPLLILILVTLGYRRLVHRAMPFLSQEVRESVRISRRWFLTFWSLLLVAIIAFIASIGASISGAPESLRMSLFLVFTVLPSALLVALILFLAYAVWAPLPNARRTLLRRLVWADVLLISVAAAGTAVLTALAWQDMATTGVITPAYSPWTTIPSGAFNFGTLAALYLAFRWVRRHPPVAEAPGTVLPRGPPSGVIL